MRQHSAGSSGSDLAAERIRARLKQADVAIAMGVSRSRIGSIELRARVHPDLATRYLEAVAAAASKDLVPA